MASPRPTIPVPKGFLAAALLLLYLTSTRTRSLVFGKLSYSSKPFCVLILCRYACRTDPNSGTCGSDVISVCVSRYIPNTGVFSTVFPSAATTEINPEWPKPKGSI
jgi:hypothetical protein